MENNKYYYYGRNAVIESLASDNKPEKIFIAFGTQGEVISKIFNLANKNKVQCVNYDRKKFNQLETQVCGQGEKSQGVIALKQLVDAVTLEDVIKFAYKKSDHPVLVALDEINDPHNLGAIARSVECSGAHGIIYPERGSVPITPTALKSSAGALEHINVAKVGNLSQALIKCKEEGFTVIGTDADALSLYSDDLYKRPIVIVIGSEGKGMRPSIQNHCDELIKIPIKGKISSLNASVSSGIILYEILRQKISAE